MAPSGRTLRKVKPLPLDPTNVLPLELNIWLVLLTLKLLGWSRLISWVSLAALEAGVLQFVLVVSPFQEVVAAQEQSTAPASNATKATAACTIRLVGIRLLFITHHCFLDPTIGK